jgi:DMSO/TMAO reductase YedYZ molybdopterin-dependent catalytic subunit
VKKKATVGLLVTLIAMLLFPLYITGCGANNNNAEELEEVEVREYQGENLSSINDLRENSIKGPQHVDIKSYQLKITGLVDSPSSHTYDEVLNGYPHYKKVVSLNCVEGWSVNILWEGVLVRDLLTPANPRPGAKTVIFHAYDGYTTSFPLDYIMNNDIIMADKMNDVTLPPERGFPFQLVAESKWGYKWIKWVTEVELSDNISYQGYWESHGYSNSGDLDKGFFN